MADLTISIDIDAAKFSAAIDELKKGVEGLKNALGGGAKEGAGEAAAAADQASRSFSSLANEALQETIRQALATKQAFASLANEGVGLLDREVREIGGTLGSLATQGLDLAKKHAAEAEKAFGSLADQGMQQTAKHAADATQALISLAGQGVREAQRQAAGATQAFQDLGSRGFAEAQRQAQGVIQAFGSLGSTGIAPLKNQLQEAKTAFLSFVNEGVNLASSRATTAGQALNAFANNGIGIVKNYAGQAKESLVSLVQGGIDMAGARVEQAKQAFLGLAKSGLEEVKNKAANAKQAFEDFAQNGIEQIKTRVQEAKASLMDLAGGAVERAKSALESLTKIDFAGMSEKIKGFGEKLKGVADFLKSNVTSPLLSFWGSDDASKKVEEKIAKFKEKVNSLLSKLFEPVMPYLEQGVDMLIQTIDRLIQWFNNAPAPVRMFIAIIATIAVALGPIIGVIASVVIGFASLVSAISAIAAAGTVSVVIGVIAAAIGLLVAGITIAIGVVYGLHEAWANGFGPIASVVAIAVGLIITAFSPILGLPILIGAIAVTIYEMWAANFGGLQDFTSEVWAKIQEYIAIAMAAIAQLVAEIGADVIAWWTENYPLIEQTVQTVSDAVKAYIEGFLNAIKAFWDAHGEQIMSVVQSIWTIISTIVRTGVNVIMGVVRMVMQIINGDWAGAWNTAKDIVSRIISAIGTVLAELGNIVWQALKFVVTAIVNIGTEVLTKAISVGKSIVEGIIEGIKSLAGVLWDAAKGIITGAIDAMKKAAFINSPSRATMDVGKSLGEGLAFGMDNQAVPVEKSASKLVKGAVKKMIEEVTKAQKEFDAMAKTDTATQAKIVSDAKFSDGKSKLDQIIKLRAELGKDVGEDLPKTLEKVNFELERLKTLSEGVNEADQMFKQFGKVAVAEPKTNVQKAAAFFNDEEKSGAVSADKRAKINTAAADADKRVQAEAFSKLQDKILAGYATGNAQLQEEIRLLDEKKKYNFALTELQEREFRNAEAIRAMRAEAEKNGTKKEEIDGLAKDMEKEFKAIEALRAQKQALADQDTLYSGTMKDQEATLAKLNEQLGTNTALTEADRLKKLELSEAYKALTAEQKANIAANSEKIKEAQARAKDQEDAKAAEENVKKQMDKFKGFISDSLKTLADKGFGAMFKSIFDKFKQMLIDMATEWISSQIYKLIFKEGGKGFGDMIGKALQKLGIGGGKKETSVAVPSSGGNADPKQQGDSGTLTGTVTDAVGGGLFDPVKNVVTGKTSALAGKMSGIGALMSLAGGLIGGRVGGIISMAGTGMSIGAMFGPWGAAIGAVAGGLIGLFMGDPKKKIDKKENMPKLQKGFTDAMQQLRDLLNDRNQIFSDPDGAIQRAMDIRGQIASGFGIEFQSKKYKKIAQQQIAAKLIEADAVIKQIKEMADVARMAGKVDARLEAEFATGVYADRAFIKQHADFKRRNGLLPGGWTGNDTLPSMLAPGEMVLNPKQIARVQFNAGFDAFKGAGIPNYATGTFVGGTAPSSAPAASVSPQPVTVQIVLNNSGIVESDIKGVLVNGLKQSDVQVELVKAYDKGKTRTK